MRPCLEVSRGDVVRRRGRYGFRWRYIEKRVREADGNVGPLDGFDEA